MTDFWTIERIDILRKRKAEGKSSGAIAVEIGTTRNAVIGKWTRIITREGYRPKPKIRNMDAPQSVPTEQKPRLAVSAGIVLPALPPVVRPRGPAIGILDVTGCRWPMEDDTAVIGGRAFCNAPQKEGRSYCAAHCKASKSTEPVKTWLKAVAA